MIKPSNDIDSLELPKGSRLIWKIALSGFEADSFQMTWVNEKWEKFAQFSNSSKFGQEVIMTT